MQIKKSCLSSFIVLIFLSLFCTIGSASVIMTVTSETPDSVTVHDFSDRDVTIKKPVERIVVLDAHQQMTSVLMALGLYDRIVGIDTDTAKETGLFSNIGEIPVVGDRDEPDIEKILTLNPDVVFDVGSYPGEELAKMERAGLNVVSISLFPTNDEGFEPTIENTRILGTIVGAREQADAFADWKENYLNIIRDRVSSLTDDQKPSALYTYKWKDNSIFGTGAKNRFHYVLGFTGSSDINSDLDLDWAEVDLENVISENPSYIVFEEMDHKSGYGISDSSGMESFIASLKTAPGLDETDAVKKNQIYGLPMSVLSGDTWLAAIYLAPVFHPDIFTDFDPVQIHQEYLNTFMDGNQDISKDIFLYPAI